MSAMQAQRGFTLIELLMAMSLTTVVVMAAITAFASFHKNERVNTLQNEAQDQARMAVDRLSRELRNLAGPEDFQPNSVEVAGPYDVVFKTADSVKQAGAGNPRNLKRVRYCVGPVQNESATLYRQDRKQLDDVLPSPGKCPDLAWAAATVAAQDLVNPVPDVNSAVFSYTPASAPLADIKAMSANVVVDVNPGKSPIRTSLSSGVYLRNQNRAPVAACGVPVYSGNGRQVVLNGSASEDPEGRPLNSYKWYTAGSSTAIADGIVAVWTAPTAGSYTVRLEVQDHAGLKGSATCGTVTVP